MATKKRSVKMKNMNWDAMCLYDIVTANGFLITQAATFTDEKTEKSLYGSRSPLYGTSFEDEAAFIEKYRCSCGEFKGTVFAGEVCPLCGTVVESKGVDIKYTGWISFGNNYVINPQYYQELLSAIGKKVLPDIIKPKYNVDVNGHMTRIDIDRMDEKPSSPFYGIGLIEFKARFVEIMRYFQKKKKNKHDVIEALIKEEYYVFCSKMPVYSTILRPQSFTSDTFYFNTIDKQINPIFSLSEKIADAEEIEKVTILSRIQDRVNTLWDENFKLINSKEGFIRDQILGGPLNETARNVIIPDPTLADNEIDLSYHTFLILYAFRIIHYLMKLENISLAKAYNIWQRAYKFDSRVYEIMCYIVEKEDSRVVVNRNPTLNYYSILNMRVRKIKTDINDYTLSIPLSVLPGLNADFDGDILNIIALPTEEMKYIFRKFDPVDRMLMSRDTGDLNPYFALNKDTLINLNNFCTVQ